MCGEHLALQCLHARRMGSSPRVRGTPARHVCRRWSPGIIPACAGNTHDTVGTDTIARDHPRVCGEHQLLNGLQTSIEGSSPRVRGTPRLTEAGSGNSGIIPACAGNTREPLCVARCFRDHPRVCGEHPTMICRVMCVTGSSPRVRGTLAAHVDLRRVAGIIPACAGNTSASRRLCSTTQDHPRVCGEHGISPANTPVRTGSSPRVRGTRAACFPPRGSGGIIPACAGNTSEHSYCPEPSGDHPRVCGEHTKKIA